MGQTAQASSAASDLIVGIARAAAQPMKLTPVYPMYLIHICARALRALVPHDPEAIVASVGDVEHLGDVHWAVTVKDVYGQEYRVAVEVLPRAGKAGGK